MSTLLNSNKIFQGKLAPLPAVRPPQLIGSTMGNTVSNGSCSLVATGNGVYSLTTPRERDPLLDITFDCAGTSAQGVEAQGKLVFTLSQEGIWAAITIDASADIPTATMSLLGDYTTGVVVSGLLSLSLSLFPTGIIHFATSVKFNWVKWSKIGSLDFTIDRSNIAGERPLDWKGRVYALLQLQNKIVAYGESGVSFLIPVNNIFSLDTIYRIGLKGKHAVAGDKHKHFFINSFGQLWKLSDGMKLLDYSEYLSELNANVVLSYDKYNNLLYICDGLVGYVYDVATGNLGRCQPNITGFDYQSGIQYVAASDTITTDPFEICTDIYDAETRSGKTVYSLEFGTNLLTGLYASIDYRRAKSDTFSQTPWYSVSSYGRVFITAWGREFRIRVKTLVYESFDLDYIIVNGVNDAY